MALEPGRMLTLSSGSGMNYREGLESELGACGGIHRLGSVVTVLGEFCPFRHLSGPVFPYVGTQWMVPVPSLPTKDFALCKQKNGQARGHLWLRGSSVPFGCISSQSLQGLPAAQKAAQPRGLWRWRRWRWGDGWRC